MQEHYISITGGNDKGTFATSLGYYNEDGQIIGTGYKRFNGSVNGSYKVFPFLNVKAGATYTWASKPSLGLVKTKVLPNPFFNVPHGTPMMKRVIQHQEVVLPTVILPISGTN